MYMYTDMYMYIDMYIYHLVHISHRVSHMSFVTAVSHTVLARSSDKGDRGVH